MTHLASLIGGFCRWVERHGRLVLIGGLVAGIALPSLALAMRPYLGPLVCMMLFANAFRIGWKPVAGQLKDLGSSVTAVLVFQLAVPMIAALVLLALGQTGPLAVALIITLSTSSITGNPNIVRLCGHDSAPALRLLIIGTAMLPATTMIVFLVFPILESLSMILVSVGLLLLVVMGTAIAGFLSRELLFPELNLDQGRAVDGASILLMGIVVVGLMSALGPALSSDPLAVLYVLILVFAVNFGQQIAVYLSTKNSTLSEQSVTLSVVAGNRNLAIFLTALPAAVIDPILLYIACYQVPMYLTPVLLGKLYEKRA